MNPRYGPVARRAEHRCEYCHAPEAIFNLPFEIEHITPLCLEGEDDSSNLALACRSCNLYKGAHLMGLDPITQSKPRLFDPRRNVWSQNFRIDLETGAIVGTTELGRGTVARLQMNSKTQLAARQQWMRLGIFP